jgi:predicted CXXCH cytochrome family protein
MNGPSDKTKMIRRRIKIKAALIAIMVYVAVASLYSQGFTETAHGDKKNLPKGCASCHRGHGKQNTPMLPEEKDTFCFRCHGSNNSKVKMQSVGYLAKNVTLGNLEKEFQKPYHHPVEKIGIHKTGETLPEKDPSIPRHSECGDCHHHHYTTKKDKFAGIKGVNRLGTTVEQANAEYELCFKCHSNSANLPSDQKNKADLFNVSNASYHPVIAAGKNNDVPSLVQTLRSSSTIKCTDCHNNNDPTGPKGPHGSEYMHILRRHFNANDGPEQSYQYELCYYCHNRTSILGNRSFFYHNLHITVVGTSCRTCHNPHGSMRYPHLIDLDSFFIRPSNSGRLEYDSFSPRTGQCFLNCHGKNHDPSSYPGKSYGTATTSSPTSTSATKK